MIAKIISHGPTRDAAIQRMLQALAEIDIEGPATNLAFLRATLDHPAFREGQVFTGFVDKFKQALISA